MPPRLKGIIKLFMVETSMCSHNANMGSDIVWVSYVSSFSGGLADVGESRCTGPPGVKSKCFWKVVSRSSVSQTPWSARNPMKEIESCGEKCTNLCRVYKLIMISRVPGYGQSWVSGTWIIGWSHHSKFKFVGLMITLIWDWVGGTFSMIFDYHDS